MSASHRELAEARTVLAGIEISYAQERAACTVLAGLALKVADGDWATAGDLLRVPLAAIGVIGHEAHPRYPDGRLVRRQEGTP